MLNPTSHHRGQEAALCHATGVVSYPTRLRRAHLGAHDVESACAVRVLMDCSVCVSFALSKSECINMLNVCKSIFVYYEAKSWNVLILRLTYTYSLHTCTMHCVHHRRSTPPPSAPSASCKHQHATRPRSPSPGPLNHTHNPCLARSRPHRRDTKLSSLRQPINIDPRRLWVQLRVL